MTEPDLARLRRLNEVTRDLDAHWNAVEIARNELQSFLMRQTDAILAALERNQALVEALRQLREDHGHEVDEHGNVWHPTWCVGCVVDAALGETPDLKTTAELIVTHYGEAIRKADAGEAGAEAVRRYSGALARLEDHFEGHPERDCGEHRTTGARAWCFSCSEWCYPEQPCKGCELPALRTAATWFSDALRAIRDGANSRAWCVKTAGEALQDVRAGRFREESDGR